MNKVKEVISTEVIVEATIKGIQEKKGKSIVTLDLRKTDNSVTDFFIICHGDSSTQVDAIADSVMDELRMSLNERPWHKEGFENAEWILLDYFNVVVHVFQKETREFYNLEGLWADAQITEIEDIY